MQNFLLIKDGVVVQIIESEQDYMQPPNGFGVVYDTMTPDPSKKFGVGDAYTLELYLQYNPNPDVTPCQDGQDCTDQIWGRVDYVTLEDNLGGQVPAEIV